MRSSVQDKLQNVVPAIYSYLKENKPGGGVTDVATIGAQVINYMVATGNITLAEKNECKQYLCKLIGYAFRNGLPENVLRQLYNLMIAENSYNNIASSIAKQI